MTATNPTTPEQAYVANMHAYDRLAARFAGYHGNNPDNWPPGFDILGRQLRDAIQAHECSRDEVAQ